MKEKIFSIGIVYLLLFTAMLFASQNKEEWDPSEHRGLLYDYKTGEPKAIIIVGENGAVSDLKMAELLAKAILRKYNDVNEKKIDPMSIIVNDTEVTIAMKQRYNIICIGGPGPVVYYDEKEKIWREDEHCNDLTYEMVKTGKSNINWFESKGIYEHVSWDPYIGKEIIIIAGKDREATARAVDKFIEDTWKEN